MIDLRSTKSYEMLCRNQDYQRGRMKMRRLMAMAFRTEGSLKDADHCDLVANCLEYDIRETLS